MEKDPGQITVAVGRVCLRFKNKADAKNGQVFVKCVFAGEGSSLFVARPASTGSGQETPGADSTALLPPPTAQSEPVGITAAVSQALEEGAAAAAVGEAVDDAGAGDTAAATPAVGAAAAAAAVTDIGFSLDSTKFDLTEQNLSLLENTVIKIELCMRGGCAGSEDAADIVVIGTVGVKIASVLRGENQWTADLALGTYTPTPPLADPTLLPVDESSQEAGIGELTPTTESAVRKEGDDDAEDTSAGPLEYGGSTSTIRVTLATDDDTADYTLGAGSLWTDGAEVGGVPEGWKVRPLPETERSSWNDAIAQILAGINMYDSYSYEYIRVYTHTCMIRINTYHTYQEVGVYTS